MIEWFDSTILNWFQTIQNPILTPIMKIFTILGEGGAVWIILGLILLIQNKTRKTGMAVLISLLFCLIVGNLLLKNIAARPRPCWRSPEVDMLISIPKDYSFPSGHTMSSFAAAMSVFLWKKRWGLLAGAGAVLVASSRMYFYVHYPTDILAGLLIGTLLAILAGKIVDCFIQRREYVRGQKNQ